MLSVLLTSPWVQDTEVTAGDLHGGPLGSPALLVLFQLISTPSPFPLLPSVTSGFLFYQVPGDVVNLQLLQ